jgi:nucleoid-associated protein YgaU
VFLKNVLSMLVKGIPTLMIEANAIAHLAQGTTVQELDRKFEEFKSGRPRAIHLTTLPKVTVAPGDTLSGLALKHYSSVEYWPLIWDANRETVGENPNRIRPGIKLTIPALSDFSVPEKQNARHRYLTWRNPH